MSNLHTFEYDPTQPGTYAQQHAAWVLCRETWYGDLSDHCSRRSDQVISHADQPQVQTKRSMSKYRR